MYMKQLYKVPFEPNSDRVKEVGLHVQVKLVDLPTVLLYCKTFMYFYALDFHYSATHVTIAIFAVYFAPFYCFFFLFFQATYSFTAL